MEAIITKLIAGDYTIEDTSTNQVFVAKASGLFRHQDIKPKVGDYVEYLKRSDNEAYITKIMPRKNDLIRPFIANIDQALVVTSVKEPDLNLNLLDRFLSILSFNNIEAILVFTKMDLLTENDTIIKEAIDYYQKIGYAVYTTSTEDLSSVIELTNLFASKITVITGQSGVGKSSLLNLIDEDLFLHTQEISYALGRGKHTTRHTELLKVGNGLVADTPGFGNLEFIDMTEVDVAHSFNEFFEYSANCKFKGCLHINEPKCHVKEKIASNEILKSRYDNYLQFIEEVKKNRKW